AHAVHRAMAPMAKDRFASVSELRAAIEPFAAAARAPSAMAAGTPSSGSATPHHGTPPRESVASPHPVAQAHAGADAPDGPATNIEGHRESLRSVPKTIPPEGDGPPAHGGYSATPSRAYAQGSELAGAVPATVSGPPYDPGIPGTAAYEPLSPEMPPRPGGTS